MVRNTLFGDGAVDDVAAGVGYRVQVRLLMGRVTWCIWRICSLSRRYQCLCQIAARCGNVEAQTIYGLGSCDGLCLEGRIVQNRRSGKAKAISSTSYVGCWLFSAFKKPFGEMNKLGSKNRDMISGEVSKFH